MGSRPAADFAISSVAIIGGGPAGIIAAKHLMSRPQFTNITTFEQQSDVSGIWNYTPQPSDASSTPVPSTSPFVRNERPVGHDPPLFPSPMYDDLHANLPGTLMELADKKFPAGTWAFPSRQAIRRFLVEYAEDARKLVLFRYQVESLAKSDGGGWDVVARSLGGGETVERRFDAVVVANGHYTVPFIPEIPNIREFHSQHPEVIQHSKNYRRPEAFAGKKVVVVGNGPSGIDIARQISTTSNGPVLLSVKTSTAAEKLNHAGAVEVPEITEFIPSDRAVRFSNGSVETIDAIVFCTGFLYSFPFIQQPLINSLLTTGKGVHNLYKHLFYIPDPTIVFPALPMSVSPLPVSDAQSAVVAAVWANALKLPPRAEMEQWSANLESEKGGDVLHRFPSGADGVYLNEFHEWAAQATEKGKECVKWDQRMMWERGVFVEAKMRFEQQGCRATTLEELGLRYEPAREEL